MIHPPPTTSPTTTTTNNISTHPRSYKESIRVRDVTGVTAAQRATCEGPNAIALRLAQQARRLFKALHLDPFLLFVLLLTGALAVAWAIEVDVAGAVAGSAQLPPVYYGIRSSEYPLVIVAALALLWGVLRYGIDVLVPIGVLFFTAADLGLLLLAVLAVPLALFPCCETARVRVMGTNGDAVFSINPGLDMKTDTQGAALRLARAIEQARRRGGGGEAAEAAEAAEPAEPALVLDTVAAVGEDKGAPQEAPAPPPPRSPPGESVVAWGETRAATTVVVGGATVVSNPFHFAK